MSNCYVATLADRAVLRVSGEDARSFLQGLITNDIEKAAGDRAVHAGLLTPQGKILFDFFVLGDGEGYLLDCPSAEAAPLAQRLKFYRLRAKVDISEEPSLGVWGAWGGQPSNLPESGRMFPDPRLQAMGFRIVMPKTASAGTLGCAQASEAEYHKARIELGVPEGGRDYGYGDTFPHEALFDQLAGVDFNKGCYVGQEVVSRMQHRGTARKRIVKVLGDAALPGPGTPIVAGTTPIGSLGSALGQNGLALLRLDRAAEAIRSGETLKAGETAINVAIQPWARFSLQDWEPAHG